ncbi:DUF4235 domain-containing protein [Zafaria sp. Z1313]|uniref:DUF4235 domain-containing protein n=1 Tax=unclassified Zafaria TaxID=2828765 RepID=UPI002E76381A|nr:DUF4235 domain-containing protein [Zafaria sp. J156]MEE1622333.1 DUF4235 domain-containing protein [Zafaria sp. J156]
MNVLLKIVGSLISLGAGFAGAKLLDTAWTRITGEEPPKPGDAEAQAEASLRQALGFAVASAVVAAVIQVMANRGTQRMLRRFQETADEV